MPKINYNKQCYSVDDAHSVLDTLLENGIAYPYSCKIGTCQSCLTQLLDGAVPTEAQKGLKPTLVAKNYFLACQCKPSTDLTIALPAHNDTDTAVTIVEKSKFNHNVLRLRLSINNPDCFTAGQYINLMTEKNLIRSYSIANVPKEYIELHIKLTPGGLMSHWLTHYAHIGLPLNIRGPMGDCFYYNPNKDSFPLVLAGTGTGLAPLIGIINDALNNNHNGKITLIHGGVDKSDLYLHKKLKTMQKKYKDFNYVPCVLSGGDTIEPAHIEQLLLKHLKGIEPIVRLFVCGPPETTSKMKMKAFLAGVPSASIYSDSFVTTKTA